MRGTPLVKDGEILAVIRPTLSEVARWVIDESTRLLGKPDRDGSSFDGILRQAMQKCPYVFVGLLSKKAEALDPVTHEILEKVQPGDSFIQYRQLEELLGPAAGPADPG